MVAFLLTNQDLMLDDIRSHCSFAPDENCSLCQQQNETVSHFLLSTVGNAPKYSHIWGLGRQFWNYEMHFVKGLCVVRDQAGMKKLVKMYHGLDNENDAGQFMSPPSYDSENNSDSES